VTPPLSSSSDRLWACHRCELIGSEAEAERHVEGTNHAVERLDQETSDAVREEWRKEATRYAVAIAAHVVLDGPEWT
jgi:hypothetical protein